jgi:hypothetical protein
LLVDHAGCFRRRYRDRWPDARANFPAVSNPTQYIALKVFIRNALKRQLRYRLIGEHLAQAKAATPRLVSFNYDEKRDPDQGQLVSDFSHGLVFGNSPRQVPGDDNR